MKVNELKAGVVLSYISMGLGYLIALIYTPIMLRLLGKSEYGLYNLVTSVVAFLGVLNFGFGSTYTRFYLRYKVKDDQQGIAKLNGMFLLIFFFIGLVTMVASIIMVSHSELVFGQELTTKEHEIARILLLILTANLAISFPGLVFSSHITANERFIFQKLINMLSLVFNPFISIILLIMGYGSIGLAIATTIVRLLVEIGNVVFCFRKLGMRFHFSNFEPGLLKSVTRFSLFIFINLIIDQVNWNIDKFIIGRFHGTMAVAIYGVAAQINTYYISISTAISSVFVPRVHKMIAGDQDGRALDSIFIRIGRIQFMVLSLFAMLLVFFGKPFFILWAGREYAQAHIIAMFLILPVTIPLIQNIGLEIQRAKNLHRFRSLVYLGIAIVNTVLTILWVPRYQGQGAALATAIAIFLGNGLVINWYNHKRIGLDMLAFWREISRMCIGLVPPALFGIVVASSMPKIEGWIQLIGVGATFLVVYVISMWRLGLNNYERKLLSGFSSAFIGKLCGQRAK